MTTPAPGWYDAPDGTAMLRWWNGTEWTADVSPRPSAVVGPTPIPPVATPAPYTPARKRLVWPWVLGGVALLVAIAGAIVLATVFAGTASRFGDVVEHSAQGSAPVSSTASPTDPTSAAAAVMAFDKAYADEDCAEFQAVVTPEFLTSLSDDPFTCDDWLETAAAYNVDGTYLYSLTIDGAKVTGGGATPAAEVTTTEIDSSMPEPETTHWKYDLVLTGGAWLVDDLQSTDE